MFSGSRKVSSKSTPLTTSHLADTTSTGIVTPTTTGTTTQWFSLPNWRKRNVSQPASPSRLATSHSSRFLSLDKALPPTPSNEDRDDENFVNSPVLQHPSSPFPTYQESKSAEVQNVQRSAPIASRALCVSLASASPRAEANILPPVIQNNFLRPSTSSEVSNPLSQIRRTKSAHRLRAPDGTVTNEQLVERRRRGLSFGATNLFMNASDTKGKGKELESSPNLSKPSRPLSRRPSFWKRKSPTTTTSPTQNSSVMPVLPLPLVDVSPFAPEFTIEPFQLSNPNTKTTTISPSQILQSNEAAIQRATPTSTTTSSTTSFEVVDPPLRNQESSFISRPTRGSATPPLIHRLSFGVFSSPEPSPIFRPNLPNQHRSHSTPALPFPSPKPIPRPSKDSESPENYVSRLKTQVSKAEVASVLAASSDIFYTQALKAYIDNFEFSGIPLDVALRKLLMEVGLPRETQQIDRVMEAFAFRYRHCNPNLFTSDDHPYILAFSLIMLHTDAFNPSNKRKMSKADYIKNTKLPGIPTEILDCFFDNIVFAPFIFIEDPEEHDDDLTSSVSTSTSVTSAGMTTSFRTNNKVDPYYLIMNDLLDPLRVDVNSYIPLESPFTYEGTNGPWDQEHLHDTFMKARQIDVELPLAFRSTFGLYPTVSPVSPDNCQETCRLKVIKGGVLNKKDDLAEGGKKALSRKWKTWGVVLSGSHLLFSRDPTWASVSLASQERGQQFGGATEAKLRPDDIYSLKDGIAVYDRSYKKYNHTFRYVLPDGRHLLLQAANDEDLQQWISCINYASAFKSAGVRIRPTSVSEGLHLTSAGASTPHLQKRVNGQRRQSCGASITPNEFMDMSTGQAQNKLGPSACQTLADELHPVRPFLESAISTSPMNENSACVSESPLMSHCHLNNLSLSRSHLILKVIRELDSNITALKSRLESDERHARNIAILTPFRKTTRSKFSTAIQNLAKPLMQMRLEMEKLKCYRTVLHSDLVSENRLTMRTRGTTLRIATDGPRLRRLNTTPMSPAYDEYGKQGGPVASTPASLSSSTSGSFHSARENASDWPSEFGSDVLLNSPKLDFHEPEATTPSGTTVPLFERGHEDTSSSSLKGHNIQPHRDSSFVDVSQGDDDDQAEDWNKTRVAHRVSLIHIPPDFAIATRLKAVFEGNTDQG